MQHGKVKSVDRQAYRRACDICGHNWPFSKLRYIGQNRWACPDDKDGLTAEQIARHQSRMRPLIVRPRRHARLQGSIPTYHMDEALVLDLVAKYATTASTVGSTGAVVASSNQVDTAAACGLYLRELLRENQRPLSFLTRARSVLLQIGTYLVAAQYGSTTGPGPAEATNSVRYGGVVSAFGGTTFAPQTISRAGLVFLQLYAETGDTSWLDAADRVGWWMRQSQRGDALVASFTNDGAGNRQYFGGWIAYADHTPVNQIQINNAECLWFVSALRAVRGGSTSYGVTTATGDFALVPAGTIDTMIADALLLYVTGKFPYSASDAQIVALLSSTTPQSNYLPSSAPHFFIGTLGSSYFGIIGSTFASALRGLFEVEGYTARVAAIFEWLMAFTSNPAFETPANTVPTEIDKLRTGVYDPEIALAQGLALNSTSNAVKLPVFTMNGGATGTGDLYSFVAAGLLGPLYEASGRTCEAAKDALARARVLASTRDIRAPLFRQGLSGLSFQLFGTGTANVLNAALTGLIYRAAPNGNPSSRGLS